MTDDVFALLRQRRESEYGKTDADVREDEERERKHQEHLAKRRAKYAELKDTINAHRRELYNGDPVVHARVCKSNHDSYEGNRAYRVMKACINSEKARARDPEGFAEKRRGYALKSKAKRMANPETHEDIKAANHRYYERNKEQINAERREQRRKEKELVNEQRLEDSTVDIVRTDVA